jgi:poly(A) polymerase
MDYTRYVTILTTLNRAGHQAFFVGGMVRNLKLGLEPKDVDITTSATPDQVKELFPCAKFVGARFGVSLVKISDTETIEVATFRTDGAYSGSRRPDTVNFTTDVMEDLNRRDFTVNALLMDANGKVYDFVNGFVDFESKLLRSIGEPAKRFMEDPLRMLRAARFACKLDFTIEGQTLLAIKENAYLVTTLSAERVRDELVGILTSGQAARGFELLRVSGLLELVLPEIFVMRDVKQNPDHHPEGDVYQHTLGLLERLAPGCSTTLALAALLHDVGKPITAAPRASDGQPTFYGHEEAGEPLAEAILRRLKFDNDVVDTVTSHVRQHMTFGLVHEMRRAKLLRFIGQPNFAELVSLHRLDCMASDGDCEQADFVEELLTSTPPQAVHPTRLLTGRDLLDLGMTPGPYFKTLLDALMTEQLEGRVATREQALQFAAKRVA